jgi:hypothetical protein
MTAETMWDFKSWLKNAPTIEYITKYQHFKMAQEPPLQSISLSRYLRSVQVARYHVFKTSFDRNIRNENCQALLEHKPIFNITLAVLNLCTSAYWEPRSVQPIQSKATIIHLLSKADVLTVAMINDLQQIYLTWVKDMLNNWLEVLPAPTGIALMDLKQADELELDKWTVDEYRQHDTSVDQELTFSTFLQLLETTANMLKVSTEAMTANITESERT